MQFKFIAEINIMRGPTASFSQCDVNCESVTKKIWLSNRCHTRRAKMER